MTDSISRPPGWYEDLTAWITRHGGHIHGSLNLHVVDDSNSTKSRGIRASADIRQGELLIRLPAKLALDGNCMPDHFPAGPTVEGGGTKARAASPWLRCLASLLVSRSKRSNDSLKTGSSSGDSSIDFSPYLASLPTSYDTLLDAKSWTDEDIARLLAGTTLGRMAKNDRAQNTPRQRYDCSVRPYLEYLAVWNSEGDDSADEEQDQKRFGEFMLACACISTRGFHLLPHSDQSVMAHSSSQQDLPTNSYSGPYLLPYIDLLNHSMESKCTTLRRDPSDSSFAMVAERPIKAGEEICHSYGNGLTSAQLLQTFGFVDSSAVKRAVEGRLACGSIDAEQGDGRSTGDATPATLSRSSVLSACRMVATSTYPQELREAMRRRGLTDETWDVPLDERDVASRDVIPDDLVIMVDASLSDELVTLCCLPFLPAELYEEWAGEKCVFKKSVLEDYYLGKLALRSLTKAIDVKLSEYTSIDASFLGFGSKLTVEGTDEDSALLSSLLPTAPSEPSESGQSLSDTHRKAMYAITIRIEEKHCLQMLKQEIIQLINDLDDDVEEEDDSSVEQFKRSRDEARDHEKKSSNGGSSKRIKL